MTLRALLASDCYVMVVVGIVEAGFIRTESKGTQCARIASRP